MAREIFEQVLAHQQPRGFVQPRDHFMTFTPGEHNMGGEVQPDGTTIGKDWFGCTWTEVGKGAIDGCTITPNTNPLEDICDFAGHVPTPEQVKSFDWKTYTDEVLAKYDRSRKILEVRSLVGFFERMHCLVGFENALCAFYEDPDAVNHFFAAMLEYKKAVVDCVAAYMKPDIMIFDDDYGTAHSTFMSPDMWREFFPPFWKELVAYTHSKGMKCELHSCGYITPLVGDFVEAGFDILQPLQTHNDLKGIKEQWGDKLILRLAIFDKQMSALNKTEDEVRSDIRSYYATLAPGGNFIPDLVPIQDRYYELQSEVQAAFEREYFGL